MFALARIADPSLTSRHYRDGPLADSRSAAASGRFDDIAVCWCRQNALNAGTSSATGRSCITWCWRRNLRTWL